MRLPGVIFCAVLFSLVLWVHAQEACSGHGQLVDDKCACSSPLPVDAAPGWVGDKCSNPVHHVYLDGQDVEETCGEGHVCNVVTPAEPVCFATSLDEMANTSFHLAILLTSNSVDAAVTLRGLLTNFTATPDAASGATSLVPQAYPNSAAAFSFSIHTSREAPSSQLQLTRRQLGYGAYTGLYLCAESSASTTIALRAATHSCPFTIQPDGSLRLCSGRGASDSCPHGSCTCPAPYAPPANWVMTPGLGFEDCSATLQALPLAGPQTVSGLAPGAWSFFSYDWPATGGFELQVAAAAMEATQGQLVLYLRHAQLPGEGEGQHDLASDLVAGSSAHSTWIRDLTAHLALRRTHSAFRTGTWYLGVYNRGSGHVSYNLTAALYDCPNGCSGRGTCAADTATCTCSQPTPSPDCSISAYELTLGQPFTADPRDFFVYDTLVLSGAREQLQAAGATQLALTTSFTTSDTDPPGIPAWVLGRPMVLVSPNAAALANTSAGDGGMALADGTEVARLALPVRGTQYSMELGDWMLAEDGSLHVVVWNPLTGPQRRVGYTLSVAAKPSCPGLCSGHGTCDAASGKCTCQAPYIGSDCSVDSSASGSCVAGSLQPVRREDLHATCWEPCRPDGSGYDTDICADLTCDGPGEGHGQLRRKGSEQACVEDACVAGNYTVVDPSGDSLCTRRCSCPEDGGACTLEADCLPDSVQCLRGLRLEAATQRCVAGGCEEGSLRRAFDLEGGSAFAVCSCATPGDPASCSFTVPTQAAGNTGGVVSCLPGYERQGATGSTRLSDGSSLVTGGHCDRPRRRGVSGGMVFFYCLLSIFLAAGLVVGGKYGLLWYEQYRYGRSVFSEGYVSWPLFGLRGQGGGGADDW